MYSLIRSSRGRGLYLGGLLLSIGAEGMAQVDPVIGHEAEDCWPEDQFPELAAAIQPGEEILTAKVYFRSDKFPDFYYVEMTAKPDPESFLAILPKPGPETERVIYYVEAIDTTFNGGRTEEYDPEVKDPCKRRAPAAYTGSNPGIIVGATKAGAAAIPPGFQAAGIAGFITAVGVGSGVAGGLGVGTAVAVAGVAAGAAGAVVVAGGDATTTVPSAGPPSTTSVPTGGAPATVLPSTTTTATPTTTTPTTPTTTTPTTTTPTTTTPTTTTPTTTTPTTTTPTTTTPTTTTPTTTTPTTTSAAPPPVMACFTATKLNSCVWRFNGSCSTGPIVQYNWAIDPGGNMPAPRPPVNHSGQSVTIDWNPPTYGGCSGSPNITVQLTVVGSQGQTDAKSQVVRIDLKTSGERGGLRTSFTSSLAIPPHETGARGFIVLNNARVDASSSSAPVSHVFRGLVGQNTLEAYTETEVRGDGFWKFDFSSTDHFTPGSLRVESGTVAAMDGRSIVFRLSGSPGERVRFTFELSP